MATSFNTFPPVLAAWNAAGGAARLGGPTSELRDEAGGKSCDFADGASIWWSAATGAHVVHGAIKARWLQLGGPSSPLGYPSTDETAAPGGGFYNDFQNAMSIYWTQATGARVVQGLIRAKWLQSGGAGGPLGYPAADETACPGGGRVSLFSGGTSIYWSAATGAHPVRGPVRDKWLAAGGPATLGLPTGDEVLLEGGGLEQSFQAARIIWTASAGASVGPLPNVAAELSTVLGQALSDALSAAYGQGAGGPVFLPYGINVPNDLVQSGAVNTVQLQTWLTSQFDAPFAISPATASVLAKDLSHGSASQIYGTAVGFAQPLDSAGGTHDRLAAEIVGARASYGPDGQTGCIACEPDDWPLATPAQPYWTSFDFSPGSVATQPASAQPAATAAVQPSAWRLRVLPGLRPQPAPSPAAAAPAQTSTAPGPVTLDAAHLLATTRAITMAPSAFAASGAPIDPATAITVHLEHTCVTLSYTDAGQPWWNNVFLDDPAWFIPGMSRGALLPPAQGALSAVYALPTALVIVRNLRVCGALTDDAKRALASRAASLGPLSMTDASTEIESDGTTAFRRDGLQVVALFCSPLPVLPPNNAPATADAVH